MIRLVKSEWDRAWIIAVYDGAYHRYTHRFPTFGSAQKFLMTSGRH